MQLKQILFILIFFCLVTDARSQAFKFAFISDTHISTDPGDPAEDLRRTITDINLQNDLDFVVITGDITEMGTDLEIKLAKSIFSGLKIPFHILPGNHDTGWSESGGVSFIKEFGYDKFVFDHKGYRFIGCASGPYVRMSDGHVPRDAVVWLDSVLEKTSKDLPLVFLNHYPLDKGLDNWYDIIDRLKKYNTQFVLGGHYHSNRALNFEGIPATLSRSNLRAKQAVGGYNIVEVRADSVLFSERNPGMENMRTWRKIALGKRSYETGNYPRPSFDINNQYPAVKPEWVYHSSANVVSTPAYANDLVIFGNSLGKIEALSVKSGKSRWSYQTGGGIYSSAAIEGNRVIIGSGDGNIYCLNVNNGKLLWKLKTGASVLGAVEADKHIAYIGGSDHIFRAVSIQSGKVKWTFNGLSGAVVSKPLLYEGKVIFGSWDTHLYALDQQTGSLVWKWNNGSAVRNLAPAMCIPVANDGVIYVAAPDRVLSAIDAVSGKTLWRSKEASVRESIGISEDKKLIYGKTMNDEIVAFKTSRTVGEIAWRMNCGFGYEHVPSMLIENNGRVCFGTKNGVTYSIDPVTQKIVWAYKLDNSMINTVNVIDKNTVLVASMDGKIAVLKSEER